MPLAAPTLLLDDPEGTIPHQPAKTRAQVDQLGVGGPALGGSNGRDLDVERERRAGEAERQHDGRDCRRGHRAAPPPSALTMISVVPFMRSRRSETRLLLLALR